MEWRNTSWPSCTSQSWDSRRMAMMHTNCYTSGICYCFSLVKDTVTLKSMYEHFPKHILPSVLLSFSNVLFTFWFIASAASYTLMPIAIIVIVLVNLQSYNLPSPVQCKENQHPQLGVRAETLARWRTTCWRADVQTRVTWPFMRLMLTSPPLQRTTLLRTMVCRPRCQKCQTVLVVVVLI